MNETKEYPIDRFLREVAFRKDDRGYLAELRRGLSITTQHQAWEHLIPYCPDFEQPVVCAIWCTVGGLAALLVPDGLVSSESWNNLGTTMRELAKGTDTGDTAKVLKTFEPKFRRLLSCNDTVSLCEMIVGIGRTASVKDVRVNLIRLFWDLRNWDDPDKRDKTRLSWAKQYFCVSASSEGASPTKVGANE